MKLSPPHHLNPNLLPPFWCVLTIGSELLLPMCRERFVKSNPPKLQVLCGKKGGAEIIQLCLSRRTVHWPNTRPVCRMSLDHKRITGWVRKEKWWKKHTVHVIRRRRHAFCPSTGRWNYACTTGSESLSHAKTNWFKKKKIYIYIYTMQKYQIYVNCSRCPVF